MTSLPTGFAPPSYGMESAPGPGYPGPGYPALERECPRHGSRFAPDGSVPQSPGVRPPARHDDVPDPDVPDPGATGPGTPGSAPPSPDAPGSGGDVARAFDDTDGPGAPRGDQR